ncbi:hypothetical protein [Campylobacter phage vB_Cj_QDYZ]|uniref:Uncharacterized protein n=1 Tax=Campylobacter phage vB_Cj_QDYZ TaxID=3032374 RepID=A0AAF0GBW5_9CAUD|nr:hypothetical protein [Campylobacter phage CP39]WGA02306.1 hypothetical protein [Campylobacter phage vB_Cj_QDYZ]
MFNIILSVIKSNIVYIIFGCLLVAITYRYISLEKSNAVLIENEKQLTQNLNESKKELEVLDKYNKITVEIFKEKETKYKEVLRNIKDIETKIKNLQPIGKDKNETQYIIINF